MVTSGASFSIGSNIRSDLSRQGGGPDVPGPGAYKVSDAYKLEGRR